MSLKVRKVDFTMRSGIYVLTSMFESHDPLQCFLGSRWYNQGGSSGRIRLICNTRERYVWEGSRKYGEELSSSTIDKF